MGALSISTGKLSVKALFTPDGSYPQLTNIYLGPHDDTISPGKPKIGLKKDKLYEIGSKVLISNKKEFKVYFDVNDNDTGVKYIMVSQDKDFKDANWKTYDGDINLKFKEDGKKYLYIKLKDDQGNISDTYKQTIKVSSEDPDLVVTSIDNYQPDFSIYTKYITDVATPIIEGTTDKDSDVFMYVDNIHKDI